VSGMPDATTVEATFVFADIAGFTALTEAHGEHGAAALVRTSAAPSAQTPAALNYQRARSRLKPSPRRHPHPVDRLARIDRDDHTINRHAQQPAHETSPST